MNSIRQGRPQSVGTSDPYQVSYRPLNQMNIPSPDTRSSDQAMLVAKSWNNTFRDYPRGRCIHEFIADQAAQTPDRIALTAGDTQLTFGELLTQATALAKRLQTMGVGRDVLVGQFFERSTEMVTGLLATLIAGGAYVPIDPGYPTARTAYILNDANPPVILTQTSIAAKLPTTTADVIFLDEPFDKDSAANGTHICQDSDRETSLAYVIYTSGSTGQPKGVMIEHKAIVNRLLWMQDEYRLTQDDVVLQKTPYSFDVSVWEFFWPLMTGCRLVMAEPGRHGDAEYLQNIIDREQVTTLHFVPSMLRLFLTQADRKRCSSLRRVICSGEALPVDVQHDFLSLFSSVELHNLYGPTEAAVDVTSWHCAGHQSCGTVPIGKPIANIQLYILNDSLSPVRIGTPGELFIGGIGVARGYLNQPELTTQKFLTDHFGNQEGGRLFRTGDLARYLPDGNIEYLGRNDFQVKIRGFRIELGEIEATLRKVPHVTDAVVLAVDGPDDAPRLVAWLVPESPEGVFAGNGQLRLDGLRSSLSESLPDYMIPAEFRLIEKIPLTSNGKIDRRSLESFEGKSLKGATYVPPQSPNQRQIAEVIEDVLGTSPVGLYTNFFEVGGHSLTAVVVVARLNELLGSSLPPHALFEAPTVAGISESVQQTTAEAESRQLPVRIARNQPLPASFGQQRMWLMQQMLPNSATYNVPFAWKLNGAVCVRRLKHCLRLLMHRHEGLRTSFRYGGSQLLQQVQPTDEAQLPWREVNSASRFNERSPGSETAENCESTALRAVASKTFDLTSPPLWEATLLKLSNEDVFLVLCFHHSIVDEWSVRILVDELQRLYGTSAADSQSQFTELPLQYADYSAWERQCFTGNRIEDCRRYWKDQLEGIPAALNLPTDFPRPELPTGAGGVVTTSLSPPMMHRLRDVAKEEETTPFSVMLAAFQAWLHHCTQQTDVLVGTPLTLRNRTEFQQIPGFFLNTLPIRTRVSRDSSFRDIVNEVRTSLLAAYSHAALPFEQIVDLVLRDRVAATHPLHQIMFVMLEDGTPPLKLDAITGTPVRVTTGTSKNDLTLSIQQWSGEWICEWEYDTDLFLPDRVERMAAEWTVFLHTVLDSPQQTLRQLTLLSDVERDHVLVDWNQTESDYPRDKCIHELFATQAQRTPNSIAVVHAGESLTYAELSHRADSVARRLRNAQVGPGALVGICCDRSIELIAALVGILKAGAGYVPLEARLPDSRLEYMIGDSGITCILSERQHAVRLNELSCRQNGDAACILDIAEKGETKIETPDDVNQGSCAVTAMSPAYVNYTSGSTGDPKGVLVPHRGVVRLVTAGNAFDLSEDQFVLHHSTLSFDASTFEIWGPLLNGGRLVLMPGTQPSLSDYGKVIREQRVTTLWLTAGLFHLMVDEQLAALSPLQQLIAGGDVLSADHVRRAIQALPNCRIINGYGPTENTTFTCCHTITGEQTLSDTVPIGRPIANTQVYIVDDQLQPVAIGHTGELCIGGDGLAIGYLNDPNLTAERFLPNPFSKQSDGRLYRSGDLAKWRADGCIEFVGRTDHQVKIRGFRIEPGEVEAALRSLPCIQDAAVLVQDSAAGEKILVAYFTEAGDASAQALESTRDRDLHSKLSKILPAYMVPGEFVEIETIPLTANGKVDRRQLASSRRPRPRVNSYVAPATETQKALCDVWRELLQVDQVGIRDNFFELGGHSLLAARVVLLIEERTAFRPTIADVFQYPTVDQMARHLMNDDTGSQKQFITKLQAEGTKRPLFCLPGWGGGSWGFTDLARSLGPERPVYGLHALTDESGAPVHTTVEEMAAFYASQIQAIQAEGPYYLTGHSLGGWIAYAVAQELRSKGQQTAFLGMLDTQASSNVGWRVYLKIMLPVLLNRAAFHLKRAWRMPGAERWQYLRNRLKFLTMHLPGVSRPLPSPDEETAMVPDPDGGKMLDYYDAVATVYRPGRYDGSVVVFAGEDVGNFQHERFWRCFVTGDVSFHRVSGDHLSLMSGDNAAVVGEIVRRTLDEADVEAASTR